MSEPIKMGLVGIGRAGWSMHCKELKGREDKFEIAACCDVLPERMNMMQERYEGIKSYTTIEDMVKDDELELIVVATPSTMHVDHAIIALTAGKTTFLEKPIATNLKDAEKMVKVAADTGSALYFRHNRRFETEFQHIKEIIDSGKLGKIHEIRLHRHSYQRRADWQTIKSCGGGQLNNWGPHIIDHSLQFLGAPPQSIWSDLKLIAARGDAEDHLKIIFKGADGMIVDMEISGGVALSQPTFLVFGSKGALTCTGKTIKMRYLDPFNSLDEIESSADAPPVEGGFANEEKLRWITEEFDADPKLEVKTSSIWDYLFESIRNGATFPITTDEAMAVMKVIDQVKSGTTFA